MRQALDALEQIKCFMFHPAKVFTWEPSIIALRTAIEQAEKPVAWTSLTEIDWARREPGRAGSFWVIPNDPTKEIALYAAPPAAKPCLTCEALARTVMMDQVGKA